MIKFNNINMKYGDNIILSNVNFNIKPGEIFVIVGPSGSGKSTLLKMINKMVIPCSGEIYIEGKEINEYDKLELRKSIGYMMQKVGLFPHMNCIENIRVPFELKKISVDKENVEKLIKKTNLTKEKINKYPSDLSGGEQQRVGIIRALATNPNLILMDEPFSALDPMIRRSLQDLIIELQKEMKKTFVFVTHDMDEAIKVADRICFIKGGVIEQIGTPEEIHKSPNSKYVSDFFNMEVN